MPKTSGFGKTDIRFWREKVFRRKRGSVTDSNWTAQMQYIGRREQFPLGTPNKAAAAARARDIYLSLCTHGWEKTLKQYKPKPEEPKPEKSTVGDLIREVAASTNYRLSTFSVYCAALRRIASDIARIKGSKSRFAPKSAGNKEWREQVDALPLDCLTSEAIQNWKLDYINRHKQSPEAHSRAVNTGNTHIRNARSLFSAKALESCQTNHLNKSEVIFRISKARVRAVSEDTDRTSNAGDSEKHPEL